MTETDSMTFYEDYLSTKINGYFCSRAQAAAIIKRVRKSYKQDGGPGMDLHRYRVIRRSNGSIQIGCLTFTKAQVASVRKWIQETK